MRMSAASPHVDASVCLELPHDVQGIVRKFTPHPVAVLLDDAFQAFFSKMIAKQHPMPPPHPCNIPPGIKELLRSFDASIYIKLPYDLQLEVQECTPHPLATFARRAKELFEWNQMLKKNWCDDMARRIRKRQYDNGRRTRMAHFNWLYENDVDDAIELSGVLTSDFDDDCSPAA